MVTATDQMPQKSYKMILLNTHHHIDIQAIRDMQIAEMQVFLTWARKSSY